MADKMRVHILAKQLGVQSKMIVEKCQAEGLPVSNHMSTLSAGLEATIREWFSEGEHSTTLETAPPVDVVRARARRRKAKAVSAAASSEMERAASGNEASVGDSEADSDSGSVAVETLEHEPQTAPSGRSGETFPPADDGATLEVEVAARAGETVADTTEKRLLAQEAAGSSPTIELAPEERVEAGSMAAPAAEADKPPAPPEPVGPAGPQNVPRPAQLKGPRVVRYEAPEEVTRPVRPSRPYRPGDVAALQEAGDVGGGSDAEGRKRGRGLRTAQVEAPKKGRTVRRYAAHDVANEKLREWRDLDLAERQERISGATGRRIGSHRMAEAPNRGGQAGPAGPRTDASVQEPVMMRDLCAATGISMIRILPVLKREFGISASINTELTVEMAEFVGLEHGINLKVIPARTPLDEISEEFDKHEPRNVKPRPPVVTFLGHVDHGKTSLLDAIRATHVAAKEDGGITQHIGAYFLEHKTAGKVTFLDTPGHAAFTAMRARGAQMTDIAVLVVAADDGVMPQTVEAINHAKAARVTVVVALNKIDLGRDNVTKIYGQLVEQGLTPSGDWGGETDVIHTSAKTGEGIDALVEHLTALGEILDLKAGFKGPAMGSVIEAETKEGVGSVVRVLVRDGVLKAGDVVVCGNAFGKVRALVDAFGTRLKQATPSMPVEIWGLDEVPLAGDRFFVVESMQRAKTIAEDTRRYRLTEGRADSQRVRSLEDVFKRRELGEIPELNVIIKADVDGSLDALRTMLEKLPKDEVRLVIRHAGVGAVTDSDVHLADASDAIIIAFRVSPGPGAKRLADEKRVDLRPYRVIYEVSDDIRKAMEGLLKPDERIENRASCDVRDVFRISKLGPVAGCLVTSGMVSRHNLARLIRDGVVIRDGCKIDSLRRFKDDAKEVRSGLECGIRLHNFDDVKPGDKIETYEIVKEARKLSAT